MGKINRYTVLPAGILTVIDNKGFSKIMRDKAVKCVSLLINKGMQNDYNLTAFIELPKNYLKKIFGNHYRNDFFRNLIQMEIIEVNHDYLPMYGKGKSKSYRINQEILNDSTSYVPTSYSDSTDSSDIGDSVLHICGSVFEKSIVYDDLKQLVINKERLKQVTEDRINAVSVKRFKTDNEIEANWMEVLYDGVLYNGTSTEILKLGELKGLTLIQDGSRYYVDDLDQYVETKKKNIKANYKYNIDKLDMGIYFANRNTTNNRLDHNLTSMCSHLMDIIKEDNGLMEIDLCNSQFAILSYLMQKEGIDTEDARLFYKLSAEGHLYQFIQDALGYPDSQPGKKPKKGKQTMFELCFSSHKNTTGNKAMLRELFPTVIAFIDDYKKSAKHYSEFAIFLQKTESKIFIDGLYYELKQLGYWVITKHDSLLVKNEDYNAIKEYVMNKFKSMQFNCTLGG